MKKNYLPFILLLLFLHGNLLAQEDLTTNKKDLITGISNVCIKVSDINESIRFYCDGLGLELTYKDDTCAIIQTPDHILIELISGGKIQPNQSGITHICLNTYDVDATFARALAYGGKPSRPDSPEPSTYQGLRMGFVAAPSGEEIELWYIEKNGIQREPIIGTHYIKCFVHPAFTVPDMPAAVAFYEALGIRLKMDWGWGCSMQLMDKREMEIFTEGSYSNNTNSYISIGFFVGNLDIAIKTAISKGGTLLRKTEDTGNRQSAYIKGVAGETIQLVYILPNKITIEKYKGNTPKELVNLFD